MPLGAPPPATEAACLCGAPAVRSASVLVATEQGDLLVFGGEADVHQHRAGRGLGDVWTLRPPSGGWEPHSCPQVRWAGPWKCHATAGEAVPTARSNHAAASCGEHLFVFGGWSSDGRRPLAHPELLHLGTRCWTECATTNAPPPPRGNPSLVYSAPRHLAVVYGGWDLRERLDDVWCLDMESWTWHRAALRGGHGRVDADDDEAPCARTDHAAVLWQEGPQREHMLVFGGSTGEGASDELWSLDCSGGEPAEWRWADKRRGAAAARGRPRGPRTRPASPAPARARGCS
ncbi:unnamed protein product [Prorocentrum cordatum]|uniref:Uncharacterized protein n=1 Tax=Prorocentrum cordatum TaxID=2364126 RepID=A0ABN9PQZ8_9DINO|nr:unnamed protein product [Polarella glacialis]